MQVADGVLQFKVPMPGGPTRPGGRERYTLTYAIDTPEGWVMVDAGADSDSGLEALETQLSSAGLAPHDISLIVMTHGHYDHFGLAARVRELTGAPIALHRMDATNPYVLPFDPQARPTDVDVLLEGGEELLPHSGLWTIWTPGHTPGHICIHDRKRKLLFSGDHVLPITTPNVSRYPSDNGNPLKDFLEAHLALAKLDVVRVHPAHEHSFEDLQKRVGEILLHHEQRAAEIMDVVAGTLCTVEDVAARISWNVGTWNDMRPETRTMAIWETSAHLHFLVEEGRLLKQDIGPKALLERFQDVLGSGPERRMALIGAGRLGRATIALPELSAAGYRFVAAFDADPRQVGQTADSLVIQPIDKLEEVVASSDITVAVVAVPPQHAQGVVDKLVTSGIETIVNYSPGAIKVPPHVRLVHIDAVKAFQSSTYAPGG